jgi:hypothetical protein
MYAPAATRLCMSGPTVSDLARRTVFGFVQLLVVLGVVLFPEPLSASAAEDLNVLELVQTLVGGDGPPNRLQQRERFARQILSQLCQQSEPISPSSTASAFRSWSSCCASAASV